LNTMRLSQTSHVDDATVLLMADGEASPEQLANVTQHLRTCPDCRLRISQAATASAEFGLARRRVIDPLLPSASQSRARFRAQLSRLAAQTNPSFWARLSSSLRQIPLPAYVTSAVAAATLVIFSTFSVLTPSLSAKTLLYRAASAEQKRPRKDREVTIRVRGRELKRHFLHGEWSVLAPAATIATDAQSIFDAAHLDWNDPLSAVQFASWHDGLPSRSDTITRSNDRVTLRTEAPQGYLVQEASLTVQESTWIPVSESFVLRDGRDIEIAETVTMPSAVATVNSPKLDPTVSDSLPSLGKEASPSSIDSSDLADAEVMARVALHAAGADDGAQVEFRWDSRDAVTVTTTVESETRKREILTVLQGIPHIRTEILTVGEMNARTSVPGGQDPVGATVLSAAVPVWQNDLIDLFPNPRDRANFVSAVLAESQRASTEAWEIRSLVRRYGTRDVAPLGSPARDALEGLLREHLATLENEVHSTAAQLRPIIAIPELAASPSSAAGSWRDALSALSEEVLGVHSELLEGLSNSSGNRNPAELRAGLMDTFRSLPARLAVSRRETSRHFLRSESAPEKH
jgi:hypothetical protein